ncbi:negative regulator of flagellin synthesis [Pseudodesulfovibrio mercurii]|uniref:Negative regulator of flagellin synthesis n=1 Tax=Pseudodesulfovibrio mercurii TaxID=641491 RepID=F0JG19_9BACT|nr:flagellar biosynthesis anti-sigma factor FlgM [Pseudodesulfovibrio mercurii]EGB15015.1 negative regulator of flagellin synthesis [Pseudodesulfovibrio mercurii]
MKGHEDSRGQAASHLETERVFDGFDEVETGRHRDTAEERARKIARLKEAVNSGRYEPDVMDIARLLTSAMDPTL